MLLCRALMTAANSPTMSTTVFVLLLTFAQHSLQTHAQTVFLEMQLVQVR